MGSSPLTRGKHLLRGLNCARPRLIPAHAGKTRGGAVSTFPREAHPRSRGENIRVRFVITNLSGSSPLTRGKQGDSLAAWRRSRLIPAHAGKTISEHANSDPAQAHPRSRGENPSSTMTSGVGSGSSPLTRGKQAIVALDCHPCRLIPAHAGKTGVCRAYPACSTAHPRSRGENHLIVSHESAHPGSSPLTRGKPRGCCRAASARGLIPAHAGKT